MKIRTGTRPVFLLLAVAAALRLAYFLIIKDSDLANIPLLDGQAYQEWALQLLAGNWDWYHTYWLGPLYPHLLALIYLVSGPHILVPLALQLLLSVVNIWLVHRLAEAMFPEHPSPIPLAASVLYAFYGPAVFYAGQLLMATLVTTLVLLIALQTLRAVARPAVKRWFFLGALVGLTATGRGNILLYPVLLGIWVWRHPPVGLPRTKALTALVLGTLLLILPVTLRNIIVADDFTLLTSNGGVNLLIGQQAKYKGIFAHVTDRPQADFDPSLEKTLEQETGRDLKGSEVSRILAGRAVRLFLKDWRAMPGLYFHKAYRFWNGYELPQITCYDFWRDHLWPLRLLPVPFFLLAAAGLPGLVLLPRPGKTILLLLILGYFLSLLPFFPTSRYRLPLVPVLAVPAAALLVHLVRRGPGWPRRAAALVLLAAALWPGWTAFSKSEVNWQVHLHKASRASRRGDVATILAEGRAAEEARPGLAETPYQLAGHLENAKDYSAAISALRLAAVRDPAERLIPYRMGRDLEAVGDTAQALAAYMRAADMDTAWFLPHLHAGLLLRGEGRKEAALAAFAHAYRLAPGNRQVRVNYASLLAETGNLHQARSLLRDLARDEPNYVNAWFNLALVEWNAGQKDAARNHLARAARLKNLTDAQRDQVSRLQGIMGPSPRRGSTSARP